MAKQPRYIVAPQSGKVLEVVSDAFSDITGLAEEMSETRDNMEEKLSGTNKYQMASDAADILEQHSKEPDSSSVEELLKDSEVSYGTMVLRRKKSRSGPSRNIRFSNATGSLQAVIEHLDSMIEDEASTLSEDDKTSLEEYRDELQTAFDELEGAVEFPGMYG